VQGRRQQDEALEEALFLALGLPPGLLEDLVGLKVAPLLKVTHKGLQGFHAYRLRP
jgi:hypothetical protein